MSNIDLPDVLPSELETLLTAPNNEWSVIIGRSDVDQEPPFVACWPIDPLRSGEGLATEDWGRAYSRWQINAFGESVAQCEALTQRILELDGWGDVWALDQIGPQVPDDVPVPAWWFVPLTVRYVGSG